ncbi:response regulator [Methanosarcina vacuolata]|uniref:Response regulator receiver n=1 Tax=Methanosarcina vacuolata Z-761 TaxID=1434123 RepID=A0A0E3Q694_9EURY|nr:response regulator [Methanosarcina vacuolata]AKB44060.1 response regulator receiver [Methanosarcina vacuolata Z-761]
MDKTKILVVEDQTIVALNIRNRLKNLGYAVPSAVGSGKEAIREAELTNVDIVLMDIMLKGDMDGIEAARIIKSRFGIPIIYLTACTDFETLERAKLTDPEGYISKPFKEEDLCKNIETALLKSRSKKKKSESF